MKTEDLIERLGTELRAVRPLAPAWQRAAIWLTAALAYVVLVAVGSWLRHGALLGVSAGPAYVVQQGALFATAMVAAVVVFASVVPGLSRPPSFVLFVPVVALMASLVWGMLSDVRIAGTIGVGRETDWPCVASIAVGATVLWVVAVMMLRRGAALAPRTTGLLAGLAAVSVANVEACLTRAHGFSVTVLVWHGLTSMVLLIAAAVLGRLTLKWPRLGRVD